MEEGKRQPLNTGNLSHRMCTIMPRLSSGKSLSKRSIKLCFDTNLSKDSSPDIDKRSKDSLQRHSSQGCNSVDPHNRHPECRLINPDQNEHHDSINESPEQSHWNANQYDEDVIHYELGVFVGYAQACMQLGERLGALVLVETFIKFQLQMFGSLWKGKIIVNC